MSSTIAAVVRSAIELPARFGRAGTVAFVSALSFAGLLLSLGVQILISSRFGTSAELDGYLLAYTLAMFTAFYIGPLREAMVPQVFDRLRLGAREVTAYLAPILGWVAAGLALSVVATFTAAFAVGRGWIVLSPAAQASAAEALFWLAPAVLLFGCSEMVNGIFACLDRPVQQQAVRLIPPFAMLLTLGLLIESHGVRALATGVIAGQAGMLVAQLVLLGRMGVRLKIGLPGRPDAKLVRMALALMTGFAASQVHGLVERLAFSGMQVGLLSAFNYGVLITNVLITVLVLAAANALYPKLLSAGSGNDRAETARLLTLSIHWVVFLGAGLALPIWMFAYETVDIVFARGRFDAASVAVTGEALRAAVFACVPLGVFTLAGRALVAGHAHRSMAVAGPAMGFTGICVIAIAFSVGSRLLLMTHWLLASTAGALVMLFLAWRYVGYKTAMAASLEPALRVLAVAAVLCAAAWQFPFWSNAAPSWLTVLVGAPIVLAAYLVSCWAAGAMPSMAILYRGTPVVVHAPPPIES